uniref:Uncharacterized protein n=1 Tax=Lactuca sativa TaxID=4236 RepID=A0A9R1WPA4_LACSA|nr:hypothetical protein LSAT_V11C100012670 [Lactuca sativa]
MIERMSSAMDRISNLHFDSPGNSLKIHVLRKWTLQFRRDETWFMVIDEHGDVIQLLAHKKNQGCIETSLLVSRCYLHMNIGEASTIEEISNRNALPVTWFHFRPRSHL